MTVKKKAPKGANEFPAECCGVCYYCIMDKDKNPMCYVSPPQAVVLDEQIQVVRGFIIEDMNDSPCYLFKPRMMA